MRETVPCFILHLLPAFISLRRRGAERMTPFSSLPRSREKTLTCRKRRSYDASQTFQKTWIQQTLKPQMSMDHIRLSSASCGCTDFVSAASGKHSPQKCIKSQKNSCKVVFFVSYDLRTLVYTFNKLLQLRAENAIQGVESLVRQLLGSFSQIKFILNEKEIEEKIYTEHTHVILKSWLQKQQTMSAHICRYT